MPWLIGWEASGIGGRNGCLLGGSEGIRGGVVFALLLCGLEGRGPCSFRGFLGLSLQGGINLDLSPKARFLLSQRLHLISAEFLQICQSRMAARSGVMPAGPEGLAFACLFTPALLRVETIFGEKRVLKVFVSCPTVGANCSCREQTR